MKIKNIIILTVISLFLSICTFASEPLLHVGLDFGNGAVSGDISLSFENGFKTGYVSDDGTFMPVMFFNVCNITVYNESGSIKIADASKGNELFTAASGKAVAIAPTETETGIPYSLYNGTKYAGLLKFVPENEKISVINIIAADIYIKGVLPSEVYTSWHPEALKAAAIATRTYTLKSLSGKHSSYGVDLCDTTCCQVYSGISKCADSTNSAVDETENLVITYNGKLITAVYHAISGGITESASGAWGGNQADFPYLTVIETPFEAYNELSRGHWRKVIYDSDFDSLISASSFKGQISSPIIAVSLDDSTPGYLNNMTITDNAGNSIFLSTSSKIRSFFGTLSSNFTIGHVYMPCNNNGDSFSVITASGTEEYNGDISVLSSAGKETVSGVKNAFFIDGKGHGHGVGLSQYGAQYAAKEGYTYKEILGIYYPGTDIVPISQLK